MLGVERAGDNAGFASKEVIGYRKGEPDFFQLASKLVQHVKSAVHSDCYNKR